MSFLTENMDTIINADCMDVLKQLPDKCVDLVLTDPPYGINYDKKASKVSGTYQGKGLAPRGIYKISNWDSSILSDKIFNEIVRVSKNQIFFGGNYFANLLPNSKCWLVWDKHKEGCWADCELAWTSFSLPVKKYDFLWNGMLQQNMKNKEKRIHPTQKPADLFGMILRDFSSENNIILDPFSGSGTTAVACHKLGRRFICIEKDPDYWAASVKRLDEERRQMTIFDVLGRN